MESLILGEEQFLSGKIYQIGFAVRASGVENVRNPPMMVGAWGYQVAVHGPVVVLAEGEAVGRVVVATVGEGNEMCSVDEADVVGGGQLDAEAAGGALVVVDFEDLAAKGGAAAGFGFVFGDVLGLWIGDCGFWIRRKQRGVVREVAGDEGLAHFSAVFGNGDKKFKTIGEAGKHFTDVGDKDLSVNWGDTVGFNGFPKPVSGQIAEGKVRIILVIVLVDEIETGGEAVTDCLAPRDMVGRGEAFVDEIEGGHEQQWFVRLLMRCAFLNRGGSDVQVVETFDGGGKEHDTEERNI